MNKTKQKIHINEAKARIVEAVMRHHGQNASMGKWEPDDWHWDDARDKYEAFLVAVQILDSLFPEAQDWTGEEMREFARACAVYEHDIAHITDDEPNAIY